MLNDTLEDTRTLLDRAEVYLLDYNGTLSNDEELCASLISEISEDFLGIAVSRDRYFSEFAGVKEESVYEQLILEAGGSRNTPHDFLLEFNRRYLERFRESITITPDAISFVEKAYSAGKKLMLVTAASREVVVPALEIAGISGYFSGVIGLEDVADTKPQPDCYLQAIEFMETDATRAVAFEDSRTGLRAARGARLSTVGILGSLDRKTMQEFTPHAVSRLHPELLP